MRDHQPTTYSGIGFFGALQIVFIVLKLTGTIGWSWFWVLSPLMAQVAIVCLMLLAALIFFLIFRK